MPTIIPFLILSLLLINSISPCHAEVLLTHNTLTVSIRDTTMKDILDDIRHQGHFNIVAFEETKIGNVRISKKFWNLPLEKGLERLFNRWNYGITRNVSTGQITVVYLVSLRTELPILPTTQYALPPQAVNQHTRSSQNSSLLLTENYGGRNNSHFNDEQEIEETTVQLGELSDEEF